VLMPDLGHRP